MVVFFFSTREVADVPLPPGPDQALWWDRPCSGLCIEDLAKNGPWKPDFGLCSSDTEEDEQQCPNETKNGIELHDAGKDEDLSGVFGAFDCHRDACGCDLSLVNG